jgi:hypothetical protein|tara:strand:- start:420 stop:1031 length:612 start_codon:yes stop_codon:yes gene_type:complete
MIQLSHIGEGLLAKMLEESKKVQKTVCGDYVSFKGHSSFIPELRLNKCGNYGFDGVHKIDVAVLNHETGICYPIEAKLGFDRLGKNEFEKRFLSKCGTSHRNTRIKGSMISILERKLPSETTSKELTVSWDGREFMVSHSWALITRKAIIDRRKISGPPRLSKNCQVFEFESLVENYGSKFDFNALIGRLISIDYYTEWRCRT